MNQQEEYKFTRWDSIKLILFIGIFFTLIGVLLYYGDRDYWRAVNEEKAAEKANLARQQAIKVKAWDENNRRATIAWNCIRDGSVEWSKKELCVSELRRQFDYYKPDYEADTSDTVADKAYSIHSMSVCEHQRQRGHISEDCLQRFLKRVREEEKERR